MKIPSLVALTCQEVTELVTDYTSGAMTSQDRARFEQHMHACTWCMTYLAQLRRTVEWVAELPPPAASVPRAELLDMYRRWKTGKP
jgi:anti-sigma factor RsiW